MAYPPKRRICSKVESLALKTALRNHDLEVSWSALGVLRGPISKSSQIFRTASVSLHSVRTAKILVQVSYLPLF